MVDARRVLVTGGAGFVGATAVRRLVDSGHSVRVFDNYSTGDPGQLAGVDAELVEGDIRDVAALAGVSIGTALAFMMAVVGLSLPEAIILRKVLKPKLIALYFGINAVGIVAIGYLFNWVLH